MHSQHHFLEIQEVATCMHSMQMDSSHTVRCKPLCSIRVMHVCVRVVIIAYFLLASTYGIFVITSTSYSQFLCGMHHVWSLLLPASNFLCR